MIPKNGHRFRTRSCARKTSHGRTRPEAGRSVGGGCRGGAGLANRRRRPHPQLLSDRPGGDRTAGDHRLFDLDARHLGRQYRAAVHSAQLPAGDLSALADPGHRLDHRTCHADVGRLPHRQPGRTQPGRIGRKPAQPHADRAAGLQDHEADFRVAVLQNRLELPQSGAGGISRARHVVAGIPVAAAERRRRRAAAARRARLGVPALHAQPDHRFLFLRQALGSDRTRHLGGKCHDHADIGRHGAAGCRRAEEAAVARRHRAMAQVAQTARRKAKN